MTAEPRRCRWVGDDPLYRKYHDEEWGVPVRDDRALFEKLLLDGFQAGLAWITILRKRESMRRAFEGFDPARLARWTDREMQRALLDPGIIRNRQKVAAAAGNARAWLVLMEGGGSFGAHLWSFVDGRPRRNRFRDLSEVPSSTPESEAMSRDLRKRGFRFVGPTICYAFMQAVGMVNDHTLDCFRHREVRALEETPARTRRGATTTGRNA